jgi:hypothetical protein
MRYRIISLTALLALGCASPTTRFADYGGSEGWPPAVNAVSPVAGQAGTVVTLKGAYLDDAKEVLIAGEPAAFTVAGAELQVTVPANLGPGASQVVVVVPRGTTAPVTFNVEP